MKATPASPAADKFGSLGTFRGFPLFQGLPDEILLMLYVSAREFIARKGEVIVREGDPGEELFIVGGGEVEVVVGHGSGQPVRLAVLGQQECFGEMCVIEPMMRSATVVAIDSAMLYALGSTTFNKVYALFPHYQAVIMANLARTLAGRIQKIDRLYFDRAY
ncbi:MAG: cyclic nucleotide-binding domain-containing protein [Candidatus Methylacidiphilales bacterium]|nr:cyclic nucleotide-binding domain-containing protein [Candidatus Methylacidiphilales bacterium]